MKSFVISVLVLGAWGPIVLSEARGNENSEKVANEVAKFQGVWRLVSAVKDGKALPEDQAKQITVTIKGSKHTVRFGGQVVANEISFELDPTASPKAVTDTVVDLNGRKTLVRGIYKLDGDTLTSCTAAMGKDRPKEFEAAEGTGRSLRVFKREPASEGVK